MTFTFNLQNVRYGITYEVHKILWNYLCTWLKQTDGQIQWYRKWEATGQLCSKAIFFSSFLDNFVAPLPPYFFTTSYVTVIYIEKTMLQYGSVLWWAGTQQKYYNYVQTGTIEVQNVCEVINKKDSVMIDTEICLNKASLME